MQDVTLIVTAFERPVALNVFLESVFKFYPGIRVVVADNSRHPILNPRWLAEESLRYAILPFDSGVSKCRNVAMEMVETKYAVILEEDFEFTEATRLETWVAILEARPDIGVIAGALRYDNSVSRNYANRVYVDYESGTYEIVPLNPADPPVVAGARVIEADYVFNFFMCRNVPEFRWDPDLKMAIEHIAFFLDVKKSGKWKVAMTPDVMALHHQYRPSVLYETHRNRTDSWKIYAAKSGLVCGVNKRDHLVYMLDEDKGLSYPEYVFRLLKGLNDSRMADAKMRESNPLSVEVSNG